MQDNYIFFDDFLGVNDTNEFGKPVNHGDDRISSTSMAINALFYIWSNASSGQLSPNVSDNVKDTLVRACDWLTDEALSDKLEHMSVFFSGSVKTGDDFPILFPANFIQRVNGSAVHKNATNIDDVICAVTGLIPEDKYQELLNEPSFFGYKISYDFQGYNSAGDYFPFWSSDTFTYAASALALSQCKVNNI